MPYVVVWLNLYHLYCSTDWQTIPRYVEWQKGAVFYILSQENTVIIIILKKKTECFNAFTAELCEGDFPGDKIIKK